MNHMRRSPRGAPHHNESTLIASSPNPARIIRSPLKSPSMQRVARRDVTTTMVEVESALLETEDADPEHDSFESVNNSVQSGSSGSSSFVSSSSSQNELRQAKIDIFSPMYPGGDDERESTPDLDQQHHEADWSQDANEITTRMVEEEGEEIDLADYDDDDEDYPVECFDPFVFIKLLPEIPASHRMRPAVLPKKTRSAPKVSLVLDLDETLVHCSVEPLANAAFTFPVEHMGMHYNVSVLKRPFMEEFLAEVSKYFEVTVFTASQKVYANTLLEMLDPKRQYIRHRLFRDSCVFVAGNYLKDLNILGRDLSQTVIVDNSPQAFGYHLDNGIPIESWFGDTEDRELLNLIPFLKTIVDVPDVRPLVAQEFQMRHMVEQAQV